MAGKYSILIVCFVLVTLHLQVCTTNICDGYSQWIYVSKEYESNVISHGKITHINSLSKALMLANLNDSCIVIEEDGKLDRDIVKWNVSRLFITSNSSNKIVTVTCGFRVGIAFYGCSNINISNLLLKKCGKQRESKRVCSKGKCFGITSALLFEDNINISMFNVTLLESDGYAITVLDGDKIFLNSLVVNGRSESGNHSSHKGLFLQYSAGYQVNDTLVQLQNCTFTNNVASSLHSQTSNKMLPFGKGGAIVILYLGSATGNVFELSGGLIDNNEATFGGGVYVFFAEGTVNNNVSFDNHTLLTNNKALHDGGGIYIMQKRTGNFISLSNVYISRNYAHIAGGGIFSILDNENYSKFYRSHRSHHGSGKVSCNQCQFTACRALMGSAAYFQGVIVDFSDLRVLGCNVSESVKSHGAVYALDSYINFFGAAEIKSNVGTAVVLDYSKLTIHNSATFSHNVGYNGGAISLYGYSKIMLIISAVLKFRSNYAENKGGAIFSSIIKEFSDSLMQSHKFPEASQCFFSFGGSENVLALNFTGSVIFSENGVKTGFGSDIYCSTVLICRQPEDVTVKDIIWNWKQFKFSSNKSNSIVTDPYEVVVFNESEWNVYPGQLITPSIHLLDERDNRVDGTAEISFSTGDVSIEENVGFIVSKRSKIQFSLLGKENCTYDVLIKIICVANLSQVLSQRRLQFCPFGFKYNEDERKCVCDFKRNRAKGIAECDGQNIYLYHDRWVPNQYNGYKPTSNISSYSCPVGYCAPCVKVNDSSEMFCLFEGKTQCAENRNETSILCSRCIKGFSVTIGGLQNCANCRGTYNWIWITLLILISLSLFVIVLILLKLDIMSYNLHGCIYSYQVMFFLYSPRQPVDSFLSIIMGLVQFTYLNSVFPKSCLWDGMNTLQKMAYTYIIPFWMLIFVYLLYKISLVHPASLFSKLKCVRAFPIVAAMAYSDIVRNSFLILNYIDVEGVRYSYLYSDAIYADDEHLPYFVSAIVILLVFVFLLPLLLFKAVISRYLAARYDDSLLNELLYYFKKSHLLFLPFYFLSRVFVFTIGIFIQNGPLQNASVALACLAVFLIFSFASPYPDWKANVIESLLLANLTVIGVLGLGAYSLYIHDDIMHRVIQVLSYVPLAVVLLSIMFKIINRFYVKKPEDGEDTEIPVPYRVRRDSEYSIYQGKQFH